MKESSDRLIYIALLETARRKGRSLEDVAFSVILAKLIKINLKSKTGTKLNLLKNCTGLEL